MKDRIQSLPRLLPLIRGLDSYLDTIIDDVTTWTGAMRESLKTWRESVSRKKWFNQKETDIARKCDKLTEALRKTREYCKSHKRRDMVDTERMTLGFEMQHQWADPASTAAALTATVEPFDTPNWYYSGVPRSALSGMGHSQIRTSHILARLQDQG